MNLKFDIYVPPSANELYIFVNGRKRVKSKKYRDWLEEAAWQIRAITTKFDAVQHDFCKQLRNGAQYDWRLLLALTDRADSDNRPKAAGDLLKFAGIVQDDKNARDFLGCQKVPEIVKGWARIVVYPVAQMAEAAE